VTAADGVRPPANNTERRLLDAALTLFAAKGYAAASVREIIEAAGVTRPVLYYYCANKEDLFKRLVRWTHAAADRELARVAADASGCENRLRAVLRGSFAFCAADPRVPRLMFQTAFGPPIPSIAEFMADAGAARFLAVQHVMQDGLDAGELAGRDAAFLAMAFCCLMDHHINISSRLPAPDTHLTPELADALVTVFLHGAAATDSRPPPAA